MRSDERWAALPGWGDFYEVSSHGRVRSHDRWVSNQHGQYLKPGRMLRSHVAGSGLYPAVALSYGGVTRSMNVHALVLLAFVGPRSAGMQVCHNDGNPLNNHLDNLRYGTRADNRQDCARHGTMPRGETHKNAKLTADAVATIRASGEPRAVLAQRYGVHPLTIQSVISRRSWRHIP